VNYLRACFHRYLLIIIPSIFVGIPYFYNSEEFSFKNILLLLIFLLSISISTILYRRIYKIKQFAPLKQFLINTNIETSSDKLSPLKLSLILAINLFISIALWLYLSVFGGLEFFVTVLIAYFIIFLAFNPKIKLFDKLFNSIIIILLTTFIPSLLFYNVLKVNIEYYNYFDLFSISFIIFSIFILNDIKNTFKDHQLEKKNLTSIIEIPKLKNILYGLAAIPYLLIIIKVIVTQSPFYLIPLFSLPMIVNILLKTHKTVGNQINLPLNIYFTYIIYHSLLVSISNIFTIKFNF